MGFCGLCPRLPVASAVSETVHRPQDLFRGLVLYLGGAFGFVASRWTSHHGTPVCKFPDLRGDDSASRIETVVTHHQVTLERASRRHPDRATLPLVDAARSREVRVGGERREILKVVVIDHDRAQAGQS